MYAFKQFVFTFGYVSLHVCPLCSNAQLGYKDILHAVVMARISGCESGNLLLISLSMVSWHDMNRNWNKILTGC